jgi:hypothetical protein
MTDDEIPTLFDVQPDPPMKPWQGGPTREQAQVGRDQALKQVEEHAAPEWKDRALEAVHATALVMESFTVDDVWRIGRLDPTRENRAMGAVMRNAVREGWIENTHMTRPSSLRSHLAPRTVWRSLIYRGYL